MKKIFKYPVEITDAQVLVLPLGARVLSAMEQNNGIVIYALVEPTVEFKKNVEIRIAGTGHDVAFDLQKFKFLSTVSTHGRFMWHVFYAE
jgi:hypothetical protein